jgi:hypothetical protein
MSILGTIVSDLKKAGEDIKSFLIKVADDAPAIMQKVTADEGMIAPVIESFLPGSALVIGLGNTLLDKIAQAVEDAGPAAAANGLVVQLDQTEVADIQAAIAAAKAFKKIPAPVSPVPVVPPAAAARAAAANAASFPSEQVR